MIEKENKLKYYIVKKYIIIRKINIPHLKK